MLAPRTHGWLDFAAASVSPNWQCRPSRHGSSHWIARHLREENQPPFLSRWTICPFNSRVKTVCVCVWVCLCNSRLRSGLSHAPQNKQSLVSVVSFRLNCSRRSVCTSIHLLLFSQWVIMFSSLKQKFIFICYLRFTQSLFFESFYFVQFSLQLFGTWFRNAFVFFVCRFNCSSLLFSALSMNVFRVVLVPICYCVE